MDLKEYGKLPFWKIAVIAIITGSLVQECQPRAHHKVHNLALYPERHSWCQATPIRQEIAHAPECEPTVIDNMVCLGACFSYSVPRAQDYQPIDPYCDKCDKTFSSWTVISLNCTRVSDGEKYALTRNVELITNCSCVDCNDTGTRRAESDEDNNAEDSGEEEIPDSLAGNDLIHGEHHQGTHDSNLPAAPATLRKLKSVSAEIRELQKQREEETMINDNKIPSDDDDDDDDPGILARLERHRASLTGQHDL